MATETDGREFSFDILPSELISAAEVQKTSMADSPEGSIGATVNIRTQRPLDNPGLHVAAAVAGIYDSMSENTKPKISGLISHTNADGTLGGLLSIVRYQRSHISERATTEGWLTEGSGWNGFAIPRNLRYDVRREDRTRTGVNAAFDWHPNDTIKLGVDAMYSKYEIDSDANAVGFFTDPGDIIDLRADENGTATWFRRGNTGVLASDHTHYGEIGGVRDSTNKQLGVNLDWQIGEQTALNFDGSWSKAGNNNDPSKNFFTNMGPRNVGVNPEWNLNPGRFPTYSNLLSLTDASDIRAHAAFRSGNNISDEIGEFKTRLTHSFYDGALSRLQFGASASSRTKDIYNSVQFDDLGGIYAGYTARVPAEFLRVFTGGNVAGAGGPTQWLTFDPEDYFSWLATEDAWKQLLPDGELYNPEDPDRVARILDSLKRHGGGFNVMPWPLNDWKVREKNYSAFAQADFEGDWGAMPWQLNVGVRYVRTDVTSDATSAQVASIERNPGNDTGSRVYYTDPIPLHKRSTYHDWLPSLNFRLNLRDNLVLRASASETLTRPTLTNLRASESFSANPLGFGSHETGNVDLKPYTSKNVDLGLEWYINDTSYIALAGFYKNVSNFIAMMTVPETILDYPFMHTMPVNAESAIIKGAEFSFQYAFDRLPAPWDGFGIQLNYTSVDSQQSFDPAIATGQFAVVGLSDSGNLVLFYEKGRFGFRAAYNWRDEYLAAIRGEQGEPSTVDAYEQLDLSTNFRLNDNLSIFAEATNVTGETESAWQRYRNRAYWWADNGRTITVGIRGSW